MKFTIDVTQDRCAATLGQFSPLPDEWKYFNHMSAMVKRSMHVDSIRGRLRFVRSEEGKQRVWLLWTLSS